MKRYAFPLTIILLLFAVIALAAPGDKHPAVTSAAIGLGTSSSPTLASITATTSVTAPAYNSTAADGYHYVLPYNSIAFAGTASVGMFQTTPTGPKWFSGTEWEPIGGGTWGSITGTLSAQTDLQAALDAISAGGITISTGTPTTAGAAYLNDSTHVLTVASTTGYTQFTGSFTAWDTTPNAFAFTDLTDVALSTTQTATPVQVTNINYPTAVTATGGTAAICTGATVGTCGTFSASPGNVVLNQYVSAQHTSSGSNSTAVNTVVTIGGVSDTFTSTTAAGQTYLAQQETQNQVRDLTTASYLGQSFTPVSTKNLTGVDIYITTASPGATVTCRIGSKIDMNATYGEEFSVVDNTSGTHWLTIPSSTHPTLTSGTTYYFACRSSVAATMAAGINTADNYAGGIRYYGADWAMSSGNSATSDLTFRVSGQ